jgi:hypothetical protein
MTEEKAEKVANILIGAAVAAAAYYILRDPGLRRTAWRIARGAIASSGPWLVAEARHAWAAAGREPARAPDSSSRDQRASAI